MADPSRYHVFISYSHHDAQWVRGTLLGALEAAGLAVCIDFRDFEVGRPSIEEMERGILESCKTVIVLTPAYIDSEWGQFENVLAQTLDPAARRRRVLPLLLQDVPLPPRIGMLTYLDMRDPAQQPRQLQRLIDAIRHDCGAAPA